MNTVTLYDPLSRFTVGFDELFNTLDRGSAMPVKYPPYNIEKINDDSWAITVAVAGFASEELEVTVEDNQLRITGTKTNDSEKNREFIHKGIGNRNFVHTWTLGQHVEVSNAAHENGLLTVSLVRIVPDELKPRRIQIQVG
jgi:molecular chaperone IbpA